MERLDLKILQKWWQDHTDSDVLVQSTLCKTIVERLEQSRPSEHRRVIILRLDSFYAPLTPEKADLVKQNAFNFDHPGLAPAILQSSFISL